MTDDDRDDYDDALESLIQGDNDEALTSLRELAVDAGLHIHSVYVDHRGGGLGWAVTGAELRSRLGDRMREAAEPQREGGDSDE